MKIGVKLSLSYGLIALVLAVISVQSYWTMSSLLYDLEDFSKNIVVSIDSLDQADRDFYQLIEAERTILLLPPGDPGLAKLLASWDENFQQSEDRAAKYFSLSKTA